MVGSAIFVFYQHTFVQPLLIWSEQRDFTRAVTEVSSPLYHWIAGPPFRPPTEGQTTPLQEGPLVEEANGSSISPRGGRGAAINIALRAEALHIRESELVSTITVALSDDLKCNLWDTDIQDFAVRHEPRRDTPWTEVPVCDRPPMLKSDYWNLKATLLIDTSAGILTFPIPLQTFFERPLGASLDDASPPTEFGIRGLFQTRSALPITGAAPMYPSDAYWLSPIVFRLTLPDPLVWQQPGMRQRIPLPDTRLGIGWSDALTGLDATVSETAPISLVRLRPGHVLPPSVWQIAFYGLMLKRELPILVFVYLGAVMPLVFGGLLALSLRREPAATWSVVTAAAAITLTVLPLRQVLVLNEIAPLTWVDVLLGLGVAVALAIALVHFGWDVWRGDRRRVRP
jgi:hypothetical protein